MIIILVKSERKNGHSGIVIYIYYVLEYIDSRFTLKFVCHSLCHGDLSMTCMSVALIRPPIRKKKNIY